MPAAMTGATINEIAHNLNRSWGDMVCDTIDTAKISYLNSLADGHFNISQVQWYYFSIWNDPRRRKLLIVVQKPPVSMPSSITFPAIPSIPWILNKMEFLAFNQVNCDTIRRPSKCPNRGTGPIGPCPTFTVYNIPYMTDIYCLSYY